MSPRNGPLRGSVGVLAGSQPFGGPLEPRGQTRQAGGQQLDLFADEFDEPPAPAVPMVRCTHHYDRAATHLGVVATNLMHPSWWDHLHPFRCACLGKFPLRLHLVRAGYCTQCVANDDREYVGPGSVHHFMPIEADRKAAR